MITNPIAVEAREGYAIWIKFDDGQEGEIDLSHLAGDGVFKVWEDRELFEDVWITAYKSVIWGTDGDEVEMCADALYLQLTGKPLHEISKSLGSQVSHA